MAAHISSGGWTAVGTLALASATVLLAAVAVFTEPLRRRFSRTHLTVEIRAVPPDMHQIEMRNAVTGASAGLSVYARIRVTNIGPVAAENVEILASRVEQITGGVRADLASFLPLSLTWSHFQPPTSLVRVPAAVFRHCDLGRFQPLPGDSRTVFVMSTIAQPNPVAGGAIPHVLEAGDYGLHLVVTGDNIEPLQRRFRLRFPSQWSDDEAAMLASVTLTEIAEESRFNTR